MEALLSLAKVTLFILIIAEGFNLIIPGDRDLIITRFLSGISSSVGNAAESAGETIMDGLIWLICFPFRLIGWIVSYIWESLTDEDEN
ncbi:MAG: hypothetical protein ABEJ24_03300 [Candidatus Magasanikbacteria bacterium]